jgi:hypothetical protein
MSGPDTIPWLACGSCRAPLPPEEANTGVRACPACGAPWEARVFPAATRAHRAEAGDRLLDDSESSCFYHPGKRAERVCDGCGRFLCGLCDLELKTGHLCPACAAKGVAGSKPATVKDAPTYRYDAMSLQLALAGLLTMFLCFPVFVITAPASLYITFTKYSKQGGFLPRARWRFVVASLLSIAQLAFMVIMIVFYVNLLFF